MQSITRLLVATVLASASVRWQGSPEYLALFAPAHQRQAYAIAVSTTSLDSALAEATADPMAATVPGAWQAGWESAPDAFGTAGPYNRWLLTRLYGSRQARVARGVRMDRGKVIESWTLISPYPSPDLRTLHPGTMRLILKVAS